MEYIVACHDPTLLAALRAFAAALALIPDLRTRGVRATPCSCSWPRCRWPWPGTPTAWLPWPPSRATTRLGSGCGCPWARPPPRGTPTCLPGLRELILALDSKVARRSGDRAAGTRALHMVSAFLVREGLTLAQEPCAAKSNEITAIPRLLERLVLDGAVTPPAASGPSCRSCGPRGPTTCWP